MSKSHNVIAVTFDEDSKEHEALSMLRQADREGRVVVRCAAIVERRLGENVRIRDGEDNSISDLYRRSREVRLRAPTLFAGDPVSRPAVLRSAPCAGIASRRRGLPGCPCPSHLDRGLPGTRRWAEILNRESRHPIYDALRRNPPGAVGWPPRA